MRRRVDQQVLWLDVSVANTQRVNVGESSERLVRIELDKKIWNWLLHLVIVLEHAIYCFRNVVHDYI